MVRRDLGSRASVLHTREVRSGGLLRWLSGARLIEVVASTGVSVPSRLPPRQRPQSPARSRRRVPLRSMSPRRRPRSQPFGSPCPPPLPGSRARRFRTSTTRSAFLVPVTEGALQTSYFRLFTDLLDADFSDELARELDRARARRLRPEPKSSVRSSSKARLARIVEHEIPVVGPIQLAPGRAASGGAGRPDGRRQNNDNRQAGGQLPARASSAASG